MDFNVIILRGLPGSGKSTLARLLAGGNDETICEADAFMVDRDGNYDFSVAKLGYCHGRCMSKFKSLVNKMEPTIVLSNTSTTIGEFKKYKEYAEAQGYNVAVVIVENYHGNTSVHDVPEETLGKMRDRFKINL